MEIDAILLGIFISYGVSFFLLYSRKQIWNTNQFRWSLTAILLMVGGMGLLGALNNTIENVEIFYWCLITPFVYNILDRIFKRLSEKRYGRDFYLWLRGSIEIDDSLFNNNPHVKTLDILFSIILLFVIVLLPLIGQIF